MLLTERVRLLPSRAQHRRLREALEHTRELYNAALQERIEAYRRKRLSIRLFDQSKSLTELRADHLWTEYAVSLQRWPLKQLDLSVQAFFRRVKASEGKAGFPRFKGRDRFRTFGFTERIGWRVRDGRLHMKGIGAIRLHFHRPLPSEPVALKVTRKGRHWYALFTVEVEVAPAGSHPGPGVGLDVGVAHLVTLSTGEHIPNPRHAARAAKAIRRAQRALARCKRGSRSRRKAKERLATLRQREANARATYLHQVSARLAREHGTIVVEGLNLKNMTRSAKGTVDAPGVNVAAKAGLNRSILDAAFSRLRELLRYKAERAGGVVIEVDPRNTSRTCSACGVIDAASRVSQARFLCTACGHTENADINAARVIARRGGVPVPGSLNLRAA